MDTLSKSDKRKLRKAGALRDVGPAAWRWRTFPELEDKPVQAPWRRWWIGQGPAPS